MQQQINARLLSASTATGAAVPIAFGGDYCFAAAGTFGGCAVGLEMLGPDGATWIAVTDSTGAIIMTAASAIIVSIPAGSYRATITGGSGVSMHATLKSAD